MDELAALPREWRWPHGGLRSSPTREDGMYGPYSLDEQPPVPDDPQLSWLSQLEVEPERNITGRAEGATPRTSLTIDGLLSLPNAPEQVPRALRRLAAEPMLQERIYSHTGCYLDLGDFAAVTTDGGRLVHVLSDQQWCGHWCVYVGPSRSEAVLFTDHPIGFDLTDDDPWAILTEVPVDGSFSVSVCADTFAEFLYRFWIENAIERSLLDPLAGDHPALTAYSDQIG